MTLESSSESRSKSNQKGINRLYAFRDLSGESTVCRQFLLNFLQLTKSRFESVRKKILRNESQEDFRGKHSNHPLKLSDEIKIFIREHCDLLPSSDSHYTTSSLKYFDNPELTFETLYDLLNDFYLKKTRNKSKSVSISTYKKYFNENVNYTFRKPKKYVCNECF